MVVKIEEKEENKPFFHVWYGDFFESSCNTMEEVNELYETIAKRDGEMHPVGFCVFKVEKVKFEYQPTKEA